jgi:hypothetical protein
MYKLMFFNKNFNLYIMLEPYAVKAACTVLRGGDYSNVTTYLNRPYAALLLLVIGYD